MDQTETTSVSEDFKKSRSCSSTLRFNSTVGTVDSDWEVYMKKESFISLNPWEWYLTFRNARLVTVEPVIFLYCFGMFLYASLYEQYFFNLYGKDKLKNTSFPDIDTPVCLNSSEIDHYTGINGSYKVVEQHSSNMLIYCLVTNKFVSIASSMIMGPLSDIYGRRPFIILVASGAVLQGVCAVLIVHFNLNVLLFILGAGISGFFGDFTAILMATFSYISDVSSGKWRTIRMGFGEAMMLLSGLLSQGLGGLWFQKLKCDFTYPLILYVACNFAIILYTLFLLPESLTKDDRERKRAGKPKGIQALVRGVMIFLFQVKEYSAWILWFMLLSILIVVLNMSGIYIVQVLFFKAINWSPEKIGQVQCVAQASGAVSLILILPILVAFKLPDALISLIGVFFCYSMSVFMGLSTITYQFFIVATFRGMQSIVVPTIRGMMSKLVSNEDQGALFSVIASGESLAILVAGVAYPTVLPLTLKHGLSPGTVFIVLAALGVIPTFLISVLLVHWCVERYRERHRTGSGSPIISERTPFLQKTNELYYSTSEGDRERGNYVINKTS